MPKGNPSVKAHFLETKRDKKCALLNRSTKPDVSVSGYQYLKFLVGLG